MVSNVSWNDVKDFYKDKFGIDGWVVELYANLDILLLCASGASNESISKFTDIPEEEVRKVIRNTFGFEGWVEDLPLNPYKVYCEMLDMYPKGLETRFISETSSTLIPYQERIKIDKFKAYHICKTMKEIEDKIKDEWV